MWDRRCARNGKDGGVTEEKDFHGWRRGEGKGGS